MRNNLKRSMSAVLAFLILLGLLPGGITEKANAQMSVRQKTDVNVVAIVNNSYSNSALDDEGRVWSWANGNTDYRLGRPGSTDTKSAIFFGRGAQVTATITSGVNLPFITQLSGAQNTTVALDRDGNVWSWGIGSGVQLGRSGANNRPGKVALPDGVKAKWITAAYEGGKIIDTQGNIWVWGNGHQNGLGIGSTTSVYPTKLTTDINNAPLPTNFIMINSSDYFDKTAAIALTADGKIYTWGSGSAAQGGSAKPKLVGDFGHLNIKKINCGNGSFGFLTEEGELYTWGNNYSTVAGELGQGNNTDLNAPKKVEYVKTANSANSSTNNRIAAPKFRDFSLYAWSLCAVDYDGNIYGSGENNYSKHGTSVNNPSYYLTRYKPLGLPDGTQIFIVSEGYSSTSYVDVDGNAYVTSTDNDAKGNNNADGSPAGPWVHFSGAGLSMFTALDSNPTSEAKRYNVLPRTSLSVETNVAATEVKYVILYSDDVETYLDGERFYDKTFMSFEEPYYFAGTNPKLLLSPNYDLWASRYYANPKISEEVFEAAYGQKGAAEKGTMDVVAGSSNKKFTKANLIDSNCFVWVQSKNAKGTTRMVYRFDNFYTQTKAWFEGVKEDNPEFQLYAPELVSGAYGFFLDRNHKEMPFAPPFGYDVVLPQPKVMEYWMLSPANQAQTKLVDGIERRVNPDKEIFLDDVSLMGDEFTKQPRVTFTYAKDPSKWADVRLHFVGEDGAPVDVIDPDSGERMAQPVVLPQFAPIGLPHIDGQDPYIPPEAEDDSTKAVGYSLDIAPVAGDGSDYTQCAFPDGFKPVVTHTGQDIYIVYETGMVEVEETYWDISGYTVLGSQIKNNNGFLSMSHSMKKGFDSYSGTAPAISGYAAVGYELGGVETRFDWNPQEIKYQSVPAVIAPVEDNTDVRFLYKKDANSNGIPDDEEGYLKVYWMGVFASGTKAQLNSQTFTRNGKQGETRDYFDATGDRDSYISIDPQKWILYPNASGGIYSPAGGMAPLTVTYAQGVTREVYLYYDEDYNENGTPDKNEKVTEYFRLYGDYTTELMDDHIHPFLAGDTFTRNAPAIDGYVPVGWIRGDYEPGQTDEDIHHITGNGEIPFAVFASELTDVDETVTFIYKEAAKPLTVKWVGTTYGGTVITFGTVVINGYVGEDVTELVQCPELIDTTVWIFSGTQPEIPSPVLLQSTADTYVHTYREKLDFAVITVIGASTDGKLNFSYSQQKKLTDGAYDVTSWALPGYRITGYVVTDTYGTELFSGTGDMARIDPAKGNQNVTFTYVSTITTVVVKALDEQDSELFATVFTDANVGQAYSVNAPHMDGYTLDAGQELIQVLSPVQEGTNIVTFSYSRIPEGHEALILQETGTDNIIAVMSYARGTEITAAPGLDAAYYTYDADTTAAAGVVFPFEITATTTVYYTKDMMDVVIKAVDEDDRPIGTDQTDRARKGEMYQAVAHTVQGHTLAEAAAKLAYADPAESVLTVTFSYKADRLGDVTVEYFCRDAVEGKILLYAYTVQGVVGSKFVALAMDFDGFELKSGQTDKIELLVAAAGNKAEFEYMDVRKTVTIFTKLGDNAKTEHTVVKYPLHSEEKIYPPYVSGYVLTGYAQDDGEIQAVGGSFTGVTIQITDDAEVTFLYTALTEIIEDSYADVTVDFMDDATSLTVSGQAPQTVRGLIGGSVLVNARVIPGYELLAGEQATKTHTVTGTAASDKITFTYKKSSGNVLFQYVSETDGAVLAQVSESVTLGTATVGLTPTATPSLPIGWALKGGTGTPSYSDAAVTANTAITFTLVRKMETITIQYLDYSGSAPVAAATTATGQVGQTVDVLPAPAGLRPGYVLVSPAYLPLAIVEGGPNVVKFYYEDRSATGAGAVTVIARDMASGAVISYTVGAAMAVGSTYSAPAPAIAGWKNPTRLPTSDAADGTMTISGVTVIYAYDMDTVQIPIYATDVKGEAILTADGGTAIGYVDAASYLYIYQTVQVGKSATIHAPHFSGYEVIPSSTQYIASASADHAAAGVHFQYVRTSTSTSVLVRCMDVTKSSPNDVISAWTQWGSIGTPFTVTAPSIPNYQLVQGETGAGAGEYGEDFVVTFRYEPTTTTVTIYAKDQSNGSIPGYLPIVVSGVKTGMEYKAAAPAISGYEIADDNYERSIPSVDDANNTITFIYRKSVGNVLIKAVESGNTANVIGVWSDTAEVGDPYRATPQSFTGWIAPATVAPITVQQGQNEIILAYTKQLADVVIEAVDDNGGSVLHTETVYNVQVGSQYTAGCLFLPGYALLAGEPSAKTVNVAEGENKIVFTYAASTASVFIVHRDADTGAVLSMLTDSAAVGSTYTAYALTIEGYRLEGMASQSDEIPEAPDYIVFQFAYVKDMGTVIVELVDSGDGRVITRYPVEVQFEKSTDIHAPRMTGYTLDDNAVQTVKLPVGDSKTIQFRYKSIESIIIEGYVNITVKGMNGTSELYDYTMTVKKNSGALAVNAFEVNGYKLLSQSPVTVNVAESAQTVVFNYKTLATTVTVNMVDEAGNKITASFYAPAVTGEAFTYNAPNVNGYYLVSDVIGTVSEVLADGASEVTFRYRAVTSKVTIVAKESDTNGRVILVAEVEDPQTGTHDYSVPDLTAAFYTPLAQAVSVTYNGIDSVSVEAYYSKDLTDIPIKAVDYATGQPVAATPVELKDQRRGEAVTVPAPNATGYVLVGSSTQTVIADGGEAVFRFRTLAADEVLVKAVSDTGKVLQSYVMRGTVGETVYARAPGILGWLLSDADSKSAKVGTDKEIVFLYGKNVVTVTVSLVDRNGAPIHLAGFQNTVEVAKGGNHTVYAPHVPGYVLDSAQSVSYTEVQENQFPVFTYSRIEDVVDQYVVNITVRGVDAKTNKQLYSYVVTKAKHSGNFTTHAFDVNGYKLLSQSPVIVDVAESSETVTFSYETLATTVTIHMVDETGKRIANSFSAAATTGAAFTCNAPNVNGYYLVSDAIGTVSEVLADGASEVTFRYRAVTSKVTIVAKESDTNGRVILVAEVEDPQTGTHDYSVPDLTAAFYTPLASAVSITYNGIDSVSVEAYYSKDLIDIPIKAVDYANEQTVLAGVPETLENQRRGEAVSVGAPGVYGYTLVGSGTQIVIADGTATTFRFRTRAADEVLVKAVGDTGAVLQSYVMKGTAGETLSVRAPGILGWLLSDADSKSAKVGTDKEIVFLYEKNVVTVTVSLVDRNGAAIHLAGFQNTVEVAKGGNHTVYAPHVPGYVLDGAQSVSYTEVQENQFPVFTYSRIEDVVDQYVVNITVRGVDAKTNKQLYSYVVTKARDSGSFTVTAFDVSGYERSGEKTVSLPTDGSVIEQLFEYTSLEASVTVKAELVSGGAVPGYTGILVPAVYGQPMSYNAPYIPGYTLDDAITKQIASVSTSDNTLTFLYQPAIGNVTIVLKEDGASGRVIKTGQETLEQGVETTIAIPDLSGEFYTAISTDAAVVTYNGAPITVTYYYAKQMRDVSIVTYDVTNPGNPIPLDSTPAGRFRIGETASFAAPMMGSCKLVSTTPQVVIITSGVYSQAVRFDYVTLNTDEVAVLAVDGAAGTILHSYVLNGRIGEEITVNAPQLLGWAITGPAVQTKTVPDTIVFEYGRDVVSVRLALTDDRGRDISHLAAVPLCYEVARGGDFTAHAPHIPGYILTSGQSLAFTGLAAAETAAQFTYRPIVSEDTADIVIRYIEKSNNTQIKIETIFRQTYEQVFVFSAPDAFNHGGRKYTRDAGTPASIPITVENANEIVVYYNDAGAESVTVPGGGGGGGYTTAKLTVEGLDRETKRVIYSQSVTAVVGTIETVTAPVLPYYALDDSSKSPQKVTINSGENKVTFYYNFIEDNGILESSEHIKYLNGYGDGSVRPDNAITRSEAAAIFFRLVKDADKNKPVAGRFSDVADTAWYAQSINYLASKGILTGYSDGLFRPEQTITRAEFAAMASRFDALLEVDGILFGDVPANHWARAYISSAYAKGWINGYPNGSFGPDNAITRAEVVKIINAMLNRKIEFADIPLDAQQYTDLKNSHWAYCDIIEASTEHNYIRKDNGLELWVSDGT